MYSINRILKVYCPSDSEVAISTNNVFYILQDSEIVKRPVPQSPGVVEYNPPSRHTITHLHIHIYISTYVNVSIYAQTVCIICMYTKLYHIIHTPTNTEIKFPLKQPYVCHHKTLFGVTPNHPNHQILSRRKHSTSDDASAISQLCVAVLSTVLRSQAFKHTVFRHPQTIHSREETVSRIDKPWLYLGIIVVTATLNKWNPPNNCPILAEVKG